ncbi:MAG: hypothetical protein A2381_07195 [Bdellovibrionales bacterium RIFOXYB1_FULL_37_110]|nr:MAG: hypothetical protein A2417_15070 [Bdellovibrionales bacterium RIFOXYC1_FULL_37_79]OFZ57845.1 MAG: hypothetical protein A2381_07195 [Bdellovibrionales bacterium RIFOXYB1_FULL_37_110]OFZ62811.1 MAG: hypothetical protein A2577_16715 [Bdellovibrionales bacterium RIFOXYD1_FULL_36_51]
MTRLILTLVFLMGSFGAFASSGVKIGNGGDDCEDRIKIIRDDIESWIQKGGSQGLKLPEDVYLEKYNTQMLNAFNAKITCSDEKIFIGNAEKTCKNFEDGQGIKWVQCNFERFNKTKEDKQYTLIHHEYAGISGFETNLEEESDYSISNKITAFLEYQIVKKLSLMIPVDKNDNTYSNYLNTSAQSFHSFGEETIVKCFRHELSTRTSREVPENYEMLKLASLYEHHITRGAYGEIAFNFGFKNSEPVVSSVKSMHKHLLHQFSNKIFNLEEGDENALSFGYMAAILNMRFSSFVYYQANGIVLSAVAAAYQIPRDTIALVEKIKNGYLDQNFLNELEMELHKKVPGLFLNKVGKVLSYQVERSILNAKNYLQIRDVLVNDLFWPMLKKDSLDVCNE